MRQSALIAVCVLAGCGGASSNFLGSFIGSSMISIQQTLPSAMTLDDSSGQADLVFTRTPGHSFATAKDPLAGCELFFEQSDETHAAAPTQECTRWISDGTVRTTVRSCVVTSTNGQLVMTCAGSVSGSRVGGGSYAGSYMGTFSGSPLIGR